MTGHRRWAEVKVEAAKTRSTLPPRLHFYQAFRAAMSEYLKATARYRQILADYQATIPNAVEAEIAAMTDTHFKAAMADQKFFGMEVQMYALAYLVESEAERREHVYREGTP